MGDGAALLEQARDALALVGSDPRAALASADEVVAAASRGRSPAAVATAQRAAALALRNFGDLPSAEARLRAGIRASSDKAPQAAAEARMSLAFVLLERGRVRAALTEADKAATSLDGVEAARLLSQRGLILQRSGRTDEALEAYASALPVLRRAGDERWEGNLRNNRALLHAYRGSLGAARADLLRAREIFEGLGGDLEVADADWNLGFVAGLGGDFVEALARYDEAERIYAHHGMPDGRLLLDRCSVLLAVGLHDEAATTAERAVRILRSSGANADAGEGLLILAQARLAHDDAASALQQAAEARGLFDAQDRPGWSLLARSVALDAQSRTGDTARTLSSARRLVDALAAAGWREETLDALLIAGTAALELGRTADGEELLARARPARLRGSVTLRVRGWQAEAQLRLHNGDRRGALRAVDAGLDAVRRQQGLLGAAELRAHVAAHGRDLASLGLGIALSSGRALAVLNQAERWRAGSLRHTSPRPPDDPELADLLTQLRRIDSAASARRLGDADSAASTPRVTLKQLEERIRARRRVVGGPSSQASARPSTSELREHLGDRALVELVVHAGVLHAVTLVDGRARLRQLSSYDAVRVEIGALHFAMTRLSTGVVSSRLMDAARASAERLDSLLLAPLPEVDDRPLVVSPTGVLQAAPWAALPSLVGRAVEVAPSATAWLSASSRPSAGHDVTLVAGPDLPSAVVEIEALRRSRPSARVLMPDEATVDQVLATIDGASVAHLATHGELRADNPMFSALRVADGALTVYDLERLTQVPPLVVLPACRSAVGVVRAGDETLGLASALLGLGARTVVAAVVPVRDDETCKLMVDLHAALDSGVGPAGALATATSAAHARGSAVGDAFVCLGAG